MRCHASHERGSAAVAGAATPPAGPVAATAPQGRLLQQLSDWWEGLSTAEAAVVWQASLDGGLATFLCHVWKLPAASALRGAAVPQPESADASKLLGIPDAASVSLADGVDSARMMAAGAGASSLCYYRKRGYPAATFFVRAQVAAILGHDTRTGAPCPSYRTNLFRERKWVVLAHSALKACGRTSGRTRPCTWHSHWQDWCLIALSLSLS